MIAKSDVLLSAINSISKWISRREPEVKKPHDRANLTNDSLNRPYRDHLDHIT